MKKIEGYANANDAPDVILWAKDQLPPGLTKPALLLIAEYGEQLPEVMTKAEVRAMLMELNQWQFALPHNRIQAFKDEAAKHGITL